MIQRRPSGLRVELHNTATGATHVAEDLYEVGHFLEAHDVTVWVGWEPYQSHPSIRAALQKQPRKAMNFDIEIRHCRTGIATTFASQEDLGRFLGHRNRLEWEGWQMLSEAPEFKNALLAAQADPAAQEHPIDVVIASAQAALKEEAVAQTQQEKAAADLQAAQEQSKLVEQQRQQHMHALQGGLVSVAQQATQPVAQLPAVDAQPVAAQVAAPDLAAAAPVDPVGSVAQSPAATDPAAAVTTNEAAGAAPAAQ